MTPVAPIEPLGAALESGAVDFMSTVRGEAPNSGFAKALTSAVDGLSAALNRADALAAGAAAGKTSIADAAIARAKADVLLQIEAVAASRVSGAIATLLQTQV